MTRSISVFAHNQLADILDGMGISPSDNMNTRINELSSQVKRKLQEARTDQQSPPRRGSYTFEDKELFQLIEVLDILRAGSSEVHTLSERIAILLDHLKENGLEKKLPYYSGATAGLRVSLHHAHFEKLCQLLSANSPVPVNIHNFVDVMRDYFFLGGSIAPMQTKEVMERIYALEVVIGDVRGTLKQIIEKEEKTEDGESVANYAARALNNFTTIQDDWWYEETRSCPIESVVGYGCKELIDQTHNLLSNCPDLNREHREQVVKAMCHQCDVWMNG